MLKKRGAILFIAICCFWSMNLLGCSNETEINFVDRSEGWDESFLYEMTCVFDAISADSFPKKDCYVEMKAFCLPDILQYGRVEKTEMFEKAEMALRHYYGDRYIDAGTGTYCGVVHGYQVTSTDDDSAWIFFGGETAVVVSKDAGEVLVCVDTRLQPEYRLWMYDWRSKTQSLFCRYTCDLAQLTEWELKELVDIQSGYSGKEYSLYDIDEFSLPLTAEEAFKIAVRSSENGKLGPAQMRYITGDFKVYYCEKSDSFAVVASQFIEILSRKEGELLFYKGLYQDGDVSTQEDMPESVPEAS